MKKLHVALLCGALLSGCASRGPAMDHWNLGSVGARASKSFLGYRADLDGSYRERQWQDKRDISLTLRRHLLSNNPDNPFVADDPGRSEQRPPHSILPDPLYYFHVEALIVAGLTYGWLGVPLPIPIGSLIASFEPGGGSEFVQGLGVPFSGSYGGTIGEPPDNDEFRVRRR